ncbi:MAG TPA: efflux RND transporter periplasmic adaptor subunit [Candidatus Kapabacteria bacterium]|nr:efflux RND transporter periplasmic adaptor subunit [Candidatus Kapabacteria bacterium]
MKRIFILAFFAVFIGCSGGNNNGALSASGTIETTEVNIAPKSPGQLIALRVDEGSIVHAGDTIGVIDTTNYVINYQSAVAAEAQAEAQLLLLEHGSRHEDIEQAAAQVEQAKATDQNAQTNYKRIKDLFAVNAATQKQLDDAQTQLATSEADYQAIQKVFEKLKTGSRAEDIDAAKARYDQTKAQADYGLQQLHDCVVTSLVSGTVTHKVANQGEMVGANSTIVTVSVLDPVKLTIYVSDKDLGKVRIGQKADVTIDTYKDKKFQGNVIYVSPDAEFTPKDVQTQEDREKLVFAVKILVPNPDGALKPGMPADAVLQ